MRIEINVASHTLELPSADRYVELIVIGGVAALPAFQGLDEDASARLIEAIRSDIAGSIDDPTIDGRLVIPAEASAVTIGRKVS